MLDKLPISEGIGPMRWLFPKSKILRLLNLPISFGIVPSRRFPCKTLHKHSMKHQTTYSCEYCQERWKAYSSWRKVNWHNSGARNPFIDEADMFLHTTRKIKITLHYSLIKEVMLLQIKRVLHLDDMVFRGRASNAGPSARMWIGVVPVRHN